MTWPHIDQNTQDRPRPLKYHTGAEVAKTITIYSSTVSLDSDSRRLIDAGELLVKITSGTGADKYGPYSKTATDGRGSVSENAAAFAVAGHDVTLGDKAIGGWFAMCVFDKSELTMNGCSLHGSPLTTLKTAFPQCSFED